MTTATKEIAVGPGVYRNEDQAIKAARRIMRSWMDYGFSKETDIAPDVMPNPTLNAAADIIREAIKGGKAGDVECIGHCFDKGAPDHVRFEVIECSEGMPERPKALVDAVDLVIGYHVEKETQRNTHLLQKALNDGDDTSSFVAELGRLADGRKFLTSQVAGFTLVNADDLGEAGETLDFVEGLLTDGGASVVYGPSNCGKSFWVLDLAAHVATGKDWRYDEHEVEQGAVVYVALEGTVGATNRIQALKLKGILTPGAPFFLCFESVSLLEHGHSERLASSIKAAAESSGFPVKLVILDTMARAMAGGDENSGQDMTAAVQSIDAIRAATGAHVAVVHHCGKDEAKGARGHSSLRAAVDTEIEVFRPEGETISTVRVTKQRDLQIGEPMPFTLEIVELRKDRRGKTVTSCVVHHEDSMMATERGKAGRKPAASADELLDLLPADSTAAWQKAAKAEIGISESTFHRMRRQLDSRAFKKPTGEWVKMGVSK